MARITLEECSVLSVVVALAPYGNAYCPRPRDVSAKRILREMARKGWVEDVGDDEWELREPGLIAWEDRNNNRDGF
jgi:hypothetical protein